jgi:transcriptional regulator with XRE-family HTH domain
MAEQDPFAGLGRALAQLRKQAGFATQTEASAVVHIDKGQLSRWEHNKPRPTLENLGKLMAGYGVTVADLAAAMEGAVAARKAEDRGSADEELIRSLEEAIRRVEGRQDATEIRVARIEEDLSRTAR